MYWSPSTNVKVPFPFAKVMPRQKYRLRILVLETVFSLRYHGLEAMAYEQQAWKSHMNLNVAFISLIYHGIFPKQSPHVVDITAVDTHADRARTVPKVFVYTNRIT